MEQDKNSCFYNYKILLGKSFPCYYINIFLSFVRFTRKMLVKKIVGRVLRNNIQHILTIILITLK